MNSKRFIRAKERSQPENKIFVAKNLDIIERIQHILDEKQWTQKTLAQRLGKSESEISKWLSGLHNFTLQTLAKLEGVLDTQIIITPKQKEYQTVTIQKNIVKEWHAIFSNIALKTFVVQKTFSPQKPTVDWKFKNSKSVIPNWEDKDLNEAKIVNHPASVIAA